jgi:hypothetical protein
MIIIIIIIIIKELDIPTESSKTINEAAGVQQICNTGSLFTTYVLALCTQINKEPDSAFGKPVNYCDESNQFSWI